MKLTLSKKSDAAPAVVPRWHPNFRNFEKLPDTKVVRTTFFINAAAVTIALGLLLWTGNRELEINTLDAQITEAEAQIARDTKQNAEALRLTKIFTAEEAKLNEALAFVETDLLPTELIRELGATLPREIQLESVDVRRPDNGNAVCTLRASAAGSKDQASGAASAYVETLRASPLFTKVFEGINISSLTPDSRSGGALGFEIVMKFKNAKLQGKGGRK